MTVPKESVEQVTFLNEFAKEWPDVLIHSIPNGGKRDKRTAQQMKLEGLKAGIPDLFIPEWAVWIEMKRTKGNGLSADQKDIIPRLKRSGYRVLVAKGYIDALNQIHELDKNNQLDIEIARG